MMCLNGSSYWSPNSVKMPSSYSAPNLDKLYSTLEQIWNPFGVKSGTFDSSLNCLLSEKHTAGYLRSFFPDHEFKSSHQLLRGIAFEGFRAIGLDPHHHQTDRLHQIFSEDHNDKLELVKLLTFEFLDLLHIVSPLTSLHNCDRMSNIDSADSNSQDFSTLSVLEPIYTVQLKKDIPIIKVDRLGDIRCGSLLVASIPMSSQCSKSAVGMDSMNRQLMTRKNHKMNKTSKKRRRRKKKNEESQELPKLQSDQLQSSKTNSDSKAQSCTSPIRSVLFNVKSVTPNTSISFFFEHIDSGSESDGWDTCDSAAAVTADLEFEFSNELSCGLSLMNIGLSIIEIPMMSAELQAVNERWEKSMSSYNSCENRQAKVTFAEEQRLIATFPVDTYDRKGEWEIYAQERARFKRRIEEASQILSPFLLPSHRSNVYKTRMSANQL